MRLTDALGHLPSVLLGEREARGVLDGRAPTVHPAELPAGLEPGGTLRLVDGSGRLLAVARLVAPSVPVEFLRVFKEP